MMKKYFIALIAALIFFAYFIFFVAGGKYLKAKKILVYNRGAITSEVNEFNTRTYDSIMLIDNQEDILYFNTIRRIRKPFIVKKKVLGKIITEKGDSVNILICMPGAFIIDFDTGKKYGFINRKKQVRLAKILSQYGLESWQ